MSPTAIQWTDETWNPTRGCTIVSPGCINCYAMPQAHRFDKPGYAYEGLTKMTATGPVWSGGVRLVEETLRKPYTWSTPRRVFVDSMSDLFHKDVPVEFILRVWKVMRDNPQHTFQILTKRPERMLEIVSSIAWAAPTTEERDAGAHGFQPYLYPQHGATPLPNVWLGTSVEDQQRANERLPLLVRINAAVLFVSAEPLLEQIDISPWLYSGYTSPPFSDRISWVITGGESGRHARRFDVTWAYSLRKQCADAGVPFFLKQLGAHVSSMPVGYTLHDRKGGDPLEWPEKLRDARAFPAEVVLA